MKLIFKWFTNKEIKAYPGKCHLPKSSKKIGKNNKKRVNIENSQSEDSNRTQ